MATQQTNQPIRVRVNRAFVHDGKVRKVGDEVALPPALASELASANKIERADRDPSEEHRELLQAAKLKAERKAAAVKSKSAVAA